ncbi:MAG: cyclic nucleotide-binding domain-containing protein, partial [Cyanobacteria bacterium P01_H01_bin.121]
MQRSTMVSDDCLAQAFPFAQLPSNSLQALKQQGQRLRYTIGQSIISRNAVPSQVVVILAGQVRLLGHDPNTKATFSLELLEPGESLGWLGIIRGVACETAIASSEDTICWVLPGAAFVECYQTHPALQTAIANQTTKAEVCQVLERYVGAQPQGPPDFRALMTQVAPVTKIQTIFNGAAAGETASRPDLDSTYAWLISNRALANHPEGQRIEPDSIPELVPQLPNAETPLRLIGVPKTLLQLGSATAETHANHLDQADQAESPQQTAAAGSEPLGLDQIPSAPAQLPETEVSLFPAKGSSKQVHYPVVRGRGILNITLACLQMLALFFNLPFRRDVLHRVLTDQLQRTGALSLQVCGAIVEMMGLRAQLIRVPAQALSRIQTPALIQWHEAIAVLYEASSKELVLAAPDVGLIRRQPREFASVWGEQGEVLLLQKTKATPQQKFGLSWFWPA